MSQTVAEVSQVVAGVAWVSQGCRRLSQPVAGCRAFYTVRPFDTNVTFYKPLQMFLWLFNYPIARAEINSIVF